MKLTQWFDGNIKPVRVGVYQREYGYGKLFYCKFDGKNWLVCYLTIEEADSCCSLSVCQDVPWRGLAEQPK